MCKTWYSYMYPTYYTYGYEQHHMINDDVLTPRRLLVSPSGDWDCCKIMAAHNAHYQYISYTQYL